MKARNKVLPPIKSRTLPRRHRADVSRTPDVVARYPADPHLRRYFSASEEDPSDSRSNRTYGLLVGYNGYLDLR